MCPFHVFPVQSVQSHSCVRLFATPWTAAHMASLYIINFRSLLRLMSIKLVMPSNHLMFCRPLLLLSSIFPSIRVFSDESVLHIRWPNIGVSASASVLPMNIQDWFPLRLTGWISLQSKGLSSLLQHLSSKVLILQHSAFFNGSVFTSIHDTGKNHSFDCMDLCRQSNASAF